MSRRRRHREKKRQAQSIIDGTVFCLVSNRYIPPDYCTACESLEQCKAFLVACDEQMGNHPYLSIRGQKEISPLPKRSTENIIISYLAKREEDSVAVGPLRKKKKNRSRRGRKRGPRVLVESYCKQAENEKL